MPALTSPLTWRMGARGLRHPLTVGLVLLLGVGLLGTVPAQADDLDDAEQHAADGDKAKARAALAAWLDAEDEPDAEVLLRAAQIARSLPDIEALRAVRGAAETLEGSLESAPPALNLALGFAYLGLAEENLRLRTTSRSVSLYFADAIARAESVPADGPLGETAARLTAGARYAQGDTAGALKGLAAYRAQAAEVSPRFEALDGRLTYDQAAAQPPQASGHPTEEAADALKRAIASLTIAADASDLPARIRRSSRLRVAWAQHRLGAIDAADASYRATYAPKTREASMVLRGLGSLFARDPARHSTALRALVEAHPRDLGAVDGLLSVLAAQRDYAGAMQMADRRITLAPDAPRSYERAGRLLHAMGFTAGALDQLARALELDPDFLPASGAVEGIAQALANTDMARAISIYERLLTLRPRDPYVRNNYGFILRDLVSQHTLKERGGLERIKPGAPAGTLAHLERCVAVYAEATALIDPAKDADLDEATAWNLAGIVNDYGLMLHYFLDAQDAALAEQQYLRALRMTGYAFKDTYSPNLHRLYRHVLRDRDWRWYQVAREAKDAILREGRNGAGRMVLEPDEQKRAAARRDMEAARARLVQALKLDADEDGLPWPPRKENGNDR